MATAGFGVRSCVGNERCFLLSLSLAEFLEYALRLCVHARCRSKEGHPCGTDLFKGLQTIAESIEAKNENGIEYLPGKNTLLITRNALDKLLIERMQLPTHVGRAARDAEYKIRDYDNGRVFQKGIIQFAADPLLDDWFAGKEPLSVRTNEQAIIGNNTPTTFHGMLVACSPGQKSGKLFFCITNDHNFVTKFRAEARRCVATRQYKMTQFPAAKQFAWLGLTPYGQPKLTPTTITWNRPEEEIVRGVLELINTIPRSSTEPDPKADAAEALFIKLHSTIAAAALLQELASVTPEDASDALDYIIKTRNLIPTKHRI